MRTQAVGPHRNSVAGHGLGGGAATRGQNFNRFSPLADDTEVDGTPFQPVQGGHRGGANRDAGAPAAGTAGGCGGNHHGRQGGEGEESGDDGDYDPEEYEDYDDDQVTGTCDPSVLHAEWIRQRKAVQCMERNGLYYDGEEVLGRARRARDDAEQAWRDAKNPQPLAKRMLWTQSKLQRAQQSLDKARGELEAFELSMREARTKLEAKVEEAEQRVIWRRSQVDDLNAEAGSLSTSWRREPGGMRVRKIKEQLEKDIMPELAAIAEDMGDADGKQRINLVLARVAQLQCELAPNGATDDGAERYDIADDDEASDDSNWTDTLEQCDGDGQTATAASDGGAGERTIVTGDGNVLWCKDGSGKWTRNSRGNACGRPADANGESSSGAVGGAACGGTCQGSQTPTPENSAPSGADRSRGDDDGDAPRGKHRRRQAEKDSNDAMSAVADTRRGLELLQQQETIAKLQQESYANGQGGLGSEAAIQAAAQKLVLRVAEVEAKAAQKGIAAVSEDNKPLITLAPAHLEQWVCKHLGGAILVWPGPCQR